MSIRFRLLVLLAITSSSALCAAEPTAPSASASSTAEARERFQRGVALYREGSYDAALAEFKRAYEIAPNYRILFNLAQVQVERHDSVAALALFGQYLQQGGAEIDAERRTQVERDMQSLRGRVADLTVESNVSGAQLSIDGVESGTLPLAGPVQVNSGVRQVTLTKPGYLSASRSLTIAGAQPIKLALTLQPLDGSAPGKAAALAPATGAPKTADKSPGLSTPFWVSAIATGVFAGTATTFGLITLNRNQKLDDELNRYPTNPAAVDDARESVKTSALLTDVFIGASVVGAAATVYFALTSSSSSEAPAAKAARRDRLQLGASGSSLVLSGRF
jgi:tetratricopeptide (TPR) repeat protein